MDLPPIIREALDENEKIVWQGEPQLQLQRAKKGLLLALGLFVAFFLFSYFTQNFLILLIGLIFIILLAGISVKPFIRRKKNILYIATDRRVFIKEGPTLKNVLYQDIFDLELDLEQRRIIFYNQISSRIEKLQKDTYPQFKDLSDATVDFGVIQQAYQRKKPFSIIFERLVDLSDDYGLELNTTGEGSEGLSKLKGTVDGISLELELRGGLPVSEFVIRLHCGDDQGRFIYICRESLMHNFGKLFGVQDLKVGDPNFDSTFLLQCSSLELLKKVVTPEVQASMLKTEEHHSGIYQFGIRPETSKPGKIEYHKEMLSYACQFHSYQKENPAHIANAVTLSFASALALAKGIKSTINN